MKKILYSFYINAHFLITKYLLPPLIFVIAVTALIILADLMKNKGKSGLEAIKNKRLYLLSVFCFLLYCSVLISSTVTSRFRLGAQEPFSDVFGGWGFTETKYFYDFSPMWNVIMFLPACALIYFFIKSALKKAVSDKGLMIVSTCFGFGFSLIIENLQILTKTGTFQFSDLFYNTLGALLGAIIFIVIKKRISNKKHLKA